MYQLLPHSVISDPYASNIAPDSNSQYSQKISVWNMFFVQKGFLADHAFMFFNNWDNSTIGPVIRFLVYVLGRFYNHPNK